MHPSSVRGFTFIEIVISVGLLLVLSSLFIVNYNQFNQSQTVRQAASTLVMNLQAARTMASSGVKPTSGCDTLLGYTAAFTSTGYQTQAFCQVGASQQTVGDVRSYTLPSGVSFVTIPSTITFTVLNRGVSSAQQIYVTDGPTTVHVAVLLSGSVSVVP